jgi:hypothetical protein
MADNFLGFIPPLYTFSSHDLIRMTSIAPHGRQENVSYQNYEYCPLQCKEGSQSRNKIGRKALGIDIQT